MEGIGNNPLELAVSGTELVGSPRFDSVHRLGIDAEHETFGF